MPLILDIADNLAITPEDCFAQLASTGFHPDDPDELDHAARLLCRLGNNRTFLADHMIAELARGWGEEPSDHSYGPQAIVLSAPHGSNFFLRANIWPSSDETTYRASGGAAFVYGMPHDHNFNFLTHGYFGPGYWSDYYQYDYAEIVGLADEDAGLRFVGRQRLEPGRIQLYRALLDVHSQLPPDALSVSLNVMHTSGAQAWLDQYGFDLERGRITRILSHGSSEAFLRIAVGLGNPEALDLAERFGHHHPSDRLRLVAGDAIAVQQPTAEGEDEI